ncbi:MAG: class I SAM-dependent methyltransferase [Leptospiraceae bacterium]|nr:class I SAM-dependent methyltransferase [Leptospiraceae bacterium]MBL0265219.1 class I SAM-dependent methyltransferase [Leptospiraceae bacterium]
MKGINLARRKWFSLILIMTAAILCGEETKKYTFTTDWHEAHKKNWEKILKPWVGKANLNYLEVGVFEGRSLIWMHENVLTHRTSVSTAVDIFGEEYANRFAKNLELSGFSEKVKIKKGYSDDILISLPKNNYDIIYIDGSHIGHDVISDAVLSWRLLKTGGVLLFDDYQFGLTEIPPDFRAKESIDLFLQMYGGEIEILHKDYQVIVKKKDYVCSKIPCISLGNYRFSWYDKKLIENKSNKEITLTQKQIKLIEDTVKQLPASYRPNDLEGGKKYDSLVNALMKELGIKSENSQTKESEIDLIEEFLRAEKKMEKEKKEETKTSKGIFRLPEGTNLLSKKENIFYAKMQLSGNTENFSYITIYSSKLNFWKYSAFVLKAGCIDQGGGWKKCADSDGYTDTGISVNGELAPQLVQFSKHTTITYGATIKDFGDIYSDNFGVVSVYLVFIPEKYKIEKSTSTSISFKNGNKRETISLSSSGRIIIK